MPPIHVKVANTALAAVVKEILNGSVLSYVWLASGELKAIVASLDRAALRHQIKSKSDVFIFFFSSCL